MRAARIHDHGGPEVLRVEDVPEPEVGPHDVLVRQFATSVNHRDIWIRQGLADATFQVELPKILGIDVAGEVVATGDEVAGVEAGMHVTINPFIACGNCWACSRGEPARCPGFDIFNGAYAELVAVPDRIVIPVSKDVPPEHLACFPNSTITAWEMLVGKARVTPGQTVFVWAGTGGLGSAGVRIAKLAGATVIASAGSENKLEILRGLGPDLVLNHHTDDVVARVMEFTDGRGVDLVFEHVGGATWERSMQMTSPWGSIATAGLTGGATLSVNVVDVIVKQLRIQGSCVGTDASARDAARELEKGNLTPLIGAVYPLEEVAEAHHALEDGAIAGKVLISFDR